MSRARYGSDDSRGRLAGKRMISERPPEAEEREVVGRWKADTATGAERLKHYAPMFLPWRPEKPETSRQASWDDCPSGVYPVSKRAVAMNQAFSPHKRGQPTPAVTRAPPPAS